MNRVRIFGRNPQPHSHYACTKALNSSKQYLDVVVVPAVGGNLHSSVQMSLHSAIQKISMKYEIKERFRNKNYS